MTIKLTIIINEKSLELINSKMEGKDSSSKEKHLLISALDITKLGLIKDIVNDKSTVRINTEEKV